jgi:hypothetical protein
VFPVFLILLTPAYVSSFQHAFIRNSTVLQWSHWRLTSTPEPVPEGSQWPCRVLYLQYHHSKVLAKDIAAGGNTKKKKKTRKPAHISANKKY